MPKVAYTEQERERIRDELVKVALELMSRQVDFVRSIYLFQRRFCEIKAAVFFLKNKNTEGVLKGRFWAAPFMLSQERARRIQ